MRLRLALHEKGCSEDLRDLHSQRHFVAMLLGVDGRLRAQLMSHGCLKFSCSVASNLHLGILSVAPPGLVGSNMLYQCRAEILHPVAEDLRALCHYERIASRHTGRWLEIAS